MQAKDGLRSEDLRGKSWTRPQDFKGGHVTVLGRWTVAVCVYCEGKTPPRKRGQDILETGPIDSTVELRHLTGNVSRDANRCESKGGEESTEYQSIPARRGVHPILDPRVLKLCHEHGMYPRALHVSSSDGANEPSIEVAIGLQSRLKRSASIEKRP